MNIPIIYFHSVAPEQNKKWTKFWLTLELKYFKEHLKYFQSNGYKSLFLNEYFDIRANSTNNDKCFVLTFDDGYIDNYIYVFPLLKKYGFKGTIFVSPDFVDEKSSPRKTLDDYWSGKASFNEVDKWGFLTWDEMRLMEKSGIIDFQSHTLTHTKYFVSDKIVGFHHPGADSLYPIGNLFPDRKPYYIEDEEFEKLLPYGYPFFEEKSSVIAKKVTINNQFVQDVIKRLKGQDWLTKYKFDSVFEVIKPVYEEYKRDNKIISQTETEEEYRQRVNNELKLSKEIIEKELNKKVNYCCWPHGDNNEFAHKTALKLGYKATTIGKMPLDYLDNTRFDRFGLGQVKNSIFLTNLKTRYKIDSYHRKQPYYVVKKIYEFFRDRF